MIIKKTESLVSDATFSYPGIDKKICIGPSDGSTEIIMRLFILKKDSSTPYHAHDFPHVVKVEKGIGVLVDSKKNEHMLTPGLVAFIPSNETHCFKNCNAEEFQFYCIVPPRGEK